MRNLIIWNAIVAAVLAGVFGAFFQLLLGRGSAGRTALKTFAIVLLTWRPAAAR
jgi:hypothetical protein